MATNPPITIGELVAVPQPGSGVRSVEWCQPISVRVVQRFANVADRNAKYPVASAGQGALCVTLDTGTVWEALGGSWQQVAGVVTQWTAPALLNGWVNVGAAAQVVQYRKNGDRVEVRGEAKNGANNTAVFQLPAGFRPPATLYFPSLVAGGVAGGFVTLTNDGNMTVTTPTVAQIGFDVVAFSVTP